SVAPWLATNQFSYRSHFRFGAVDCVVFEQPGTQRFFSVNYAQGKISYMLQTRFSDTRGIETGTSKTIGLLPASVFPDSYRQGFPGANIDQLWQYHLSGEAYVMQKFGIALEQMTRSSEENLLINTRTMAARVRQIPLYPFRVLYWHFVAAPRFAN